MFSLWQLKLFDLCERCYAILLEEIRKYDADSLADGLNGLFNRQVEIPRIRHGKRQTLDTLINEEALLLAKFLRNERKEWYPRIPTIGRVSKG
jgi:hypothetical protein